MQRMVDIIVAYRAEFLAGLRVTLSLCLIVWLSGILGGALLGTTAARWERIVGWPVRALSATIAAIPILVLLFWLHYPAQSLIGIVVNPFYTAALALSLVNCVLVSDLVRGVLHDFPKQYIWAAQVCGVSHRKTVLRIQVPIILRQILPGILLIQISMLHASLFASLISVDEVFRVAQRINSRIYKPVEIYSALAVFFLAVTLPLYGIVYWLRGRFTRDLSDR